jgi:iron complex outermembrane receptor protein
MRMMGRAKIVAGGLALSAAVATGAPAHAEVAEDSTVEAVIVTAAKREQNLQDVPISMNVTSQEQLEAFNIADMKALSMTIPSMMVLRTNSVNTITLRGFGSGPNNPATDQTVALYNDGVYAGRARQFMAPYFDVARVEVLRGPQGALIGKNTAAGAVSIISNMPTDTFEGGVTGSYLFERNGYDLFGYVSGPISETVRGRLAVKAINDEGWVSNLATGNKDPRQDIFNIRGILAWEPNDRLEVVAKFQFDDTRVDGRAMAGFLGTLSKDDAVTLQKRASGIGGQTDHDYQKGYHGAITATLDLGGLTLVSVTGYEEFKSDSWAAAGHADPVNFSTNFFEKFQQYSQEIRLLSPAGQTFEWIVGGYLDNSQHGVDNTIRYAGRFLVFNLDGQMTSVFEQEASTASAFATGTWRFTDAARLVAGLRYTRVKKSGSYVFGRDFGQNFIGANPVGPLTGRFTENHLDPSATLQWDVSDAVMVYASYSEGSKGGTFQGANRSVTPATFELLPEKSKNYEVGFKARAFGWLTLDAAAYRLNFKDLQSGQYVNGVLLTKNAGAARSTGVEVVAAADFDQLRLDLTAAYNDAKFTDYPGAACTQAQINAGCVNGVTPVNAAGRRFAFVPRWSGRAQATWVQPVGDKLKATFTAAAYFSSSYFVDSGTFNPFIGIQDAYEKIDLRAELSDLDDRWSVALVGKNVGDTITSSGVYPWPFATPPLNVYTIDEPSSWGIQASVKF